MQYQKQINLTWHKGTLQGVDSKQVTKGRCVLVKRLHRLDACSCATAKDHDALVVGYIDQCQTLISAVIRSISAYGHFYQKESYKVQIQS